ncbi:MAG TPA: response regulator transcription factor [Mucilaginibacter sp.]|jgi:DNA-binding response OmpR family regulator
MYNILLLEDDYKMSNEIKIFLNSRELICDIVYDGALFFKHLQIKKYDLYILDVNVPLLNGMEVCKKIRMTDKSKPVLMLTAYSDVENKIIAFESGADDYLVKPFHLEELTARVKALLRRSYPPENNGRIITVGDLVVYTDEMKVTRAGKGITLTPKEYKLIELLALAEGKPVSKQTIAAKVWGINFETGTNTIEVYINYLRKKIDKGQSRALLHTRAGVGYYLQ